METNQPGNKKINTFLVSLRSYLTWFRDQSLSPRARGMFGVLIVVVLFGGVFLAASPTHAQGTATAAKTGVVASVLTGVANEIIQAAVWLMLTIARVFISLAVFFLQFFIQIAGYNNLIDAAPVKLGWLMVRDVANMFFVVALLVIAFSTILGLESYEWTKALAKLVIAAIFINFSKLILQLIIDVASVFTTTFLNAVSATAGGNLISMFKLDKIMTITDDPSNAGNLRLEFLAAAIMAVFLSSLVMMAIGAYALIMLIRVVVLWVLIILSPLAFIAQVLPQTQSYAAEFWKEFTHHVIVAPVMVFFLWLTFATLGTGDIATRADGGLNFNLNGAAAEVSQLPGAANPSVSVSKATSWESLASFAIALAFMLAGLAAVERLGVKGGGLASKAKDLGTTIGKYASGLAAARWTAGAAWKGTKYAAYHVPFGGEYWVNKGKRQLADWRTRRYERAGGITAETLAISKDLGQLKQKRQNTQSQMDAANKLPDSIEKIAKLNALRTAAEQQDQAIGEKQAELKKAMPKGPLVWAARQQLKEERKLKKTEADLEETKKIAMKRVGGEEGGWFSAEVKDKGRIKKGIFQAEEERSEAKTKEKAAEGKLMTQAAARVKFGGPEAAEETLGKELAARREKAKATEEETKLLTERDRREFLDKETGKDVATRLARAKVELEISQKGAELRLGGVEAGYKKGEEGRLAMTQLEVIKAKGEAEHKELEKEEKAARERAVTTAEGAEALKKTVHVALDTEAIKFGLDTKESEAKSEYINSGKGRELVEAQVESDTALRGVTAARSNLITEVGDARANAAKELVDTAREAETAKVLAGLKAEIAAMVGGIDTELGAKIGKKTEKENERAEAATEKTRKENKLKELESSPEKLKQVQVDKEHLEEVATNPKFTLQQARYAARELEKLETPDKLKGEIARLTDTITKADGEIAGIDKEIAGLKGQKESVSRGEESEEFARRMTEGMKAALEKLAKTNSDIAVALVTNRKNENTILQQRSSKTLEETVLQETIGRRQALPFPDEAPRQAIQAVMKDLNKITKEELLAAMKARMLRISKLDRDDKGADGKPTYKKYTKHDRRVDEIYTQAVAAKLQAERFIDDQTGTVEGIISQVKGLSDADKELIGSNRDQFQGNIDQGRNIGKEMAGRRGAAWGTLNFGAVQGFSGTKQTEIAAVLKNVAAKLGQADLAGLANAAAPRSFAGLGNVMTQLEAMQTAGGNQLGGYSPADIEAFIKEIGNLNNNNDADVKRWIESKK